MLSVTTAYCSLVVKGIGLAIKRLWVRLPATTLLGNNLKQVVHTDMLRPAGFMTDSLHVTCGMTACTLGSAPGATLGTVTSIGELYLFYCKTYTQSAGCKVTYRKIT